MMFIYPKSWKVLGAFVVAAGMSFGASGSAQAGDHCADSCCDVDGIFKGCGDRLGNHLRSMCGLWKNSDCCIDDCVADCCIVDDCVDGCCDLGKESGWNFGGWVQMGYHNKSNGMFNNNPNTLTFHQNWLYVEKIADGSCGWDWGGRFDIMYGADANDTQSFGNARSRWDYDHGNNLSSRGYGWALPQAYLEVAKGDWSIIAGHFYTLLGYEVVTAPDNFFYSHAMTMYHSEAFTHTGVLATQQVSDNVEAYYGYTLGWNTGFDRNAGGGNFLGGVSIALTDNTSLTYITTFGDFGGPNPNSNTGIGTGYSHSLVLDHNFGSCGQWNYVFQTDYVDATGYDPAGVSGALGLPYGAVATEAYGINQYLIYNVNDKLGLGTRFEWWRAYSEDSFSLTMGANIKPAKNLTIRPELRYYFADPTFAAVYNENVANDNLYDSFVFGVDAILTF